MIHVKYKCYINYMYYIISLLVQSKNIKIFAINTITKLAYSYP